ncbi:hypothetical protein ABMA27_004204 [Loxostege sticticalis]|uniref:Uncharacterized protein n=1 Tax=Loxostege sticticalis TaxID=481309 RepID=A0ABR3HMR9_LOXSC
MLDGLMSEVKCGKIGFVAGGMSRIVDRLGQVVQAPDCEPSGCGFESRKGQMRAVSGLAPPAVMLRPESPLADHRSLLPRRLLPVKAQIAPADKRKNRRSLELNPPTDHAPYDYPKLLISKTTDSLNTECPRKLINKQDSTDSLKRALLSKDEKKPADKKAQLSKQDSSESLKKTLLCRQESNESAKRRDVEKKPANQDVKRVSEVKRGSDKKGFLETDSEEPCKRIYERRTGCARPTLPPVAEKGLASPNSPNGSPGTPSVAAVAEGLVRWGSGLLSPREEPRLKAARSWYGYGTLPTDSDKMGAGANGPGGRRALELILSGGLKSLARPAKPVRRAASRDSVLSQPQPLLEGLRKCSTVLALTDREKGSEPMRAHNRLRAPSVCSRCSSLLSLAGAGGSRYSLDGAGGGFVPAAPINCKLCLEDATADKVTLISGCGCSFCTKVSLQNLFSFSIINYLSFQSCSHLKVLFNTLIFTLKVLMPNRLMTVGFQLCSFLSFSRIDFVYSFYCLLHFIPKKCKVPVGYRNSSLRGRSRGQQLPYPEIYPCLSCIDNKQPYKEDFRDIDLARLILFPHEKH